MASLFSPVARIVPGRPPERPGDGTGARTAQDHDGAKLVHVV